MNKTALTEEAYCPLTGDRPHEYRRQAAPACDHRLHGVLHVLPPGTTDEQAEHERAIGGYCHWRRHAGGSVLLIDNFM